MNIWHQDLEEYKYTCESGHTAWTPMNSNLCMQGIKVVMMVIMRMMLIFVTILTTALADFFQPRV